MHTCICLCAPTCSEGLRAQLSGLHNTLKPAHDAGADGDALKAAYDAGATGKPNNTALHPLHPAVRSPQKRDRVYPEHVGDNRPLSGMQIRQAAAAEHLVVLKKVKLERDDKM